MEIKPHACIPHSLVFVAAMHTVVQPIPLPLHLPIDSSFQFSPAAIQVSGAVAMEAVMITSGCFQADSSLLEGRRLCLPIRKSYKRKKRKRKKEKEKEEERGRG